MQCRVFRKAQSKWNLSPQKCMELFQKYDLPGFIWREGPDYLRGLYDEELAGN